MNAMNSYIKKEVALIGANTKFGKMTSFLLKQSPLLNKLTLYDDNTLKPLEDIKYINTPCQVSLINGRENVNEAIKTADIIIIGDDDPKETINHEVTLMSRAPSFSNYVQHIADHNSDAIIVVATNPVNMTVPLAAEVLRSLGKLDERKLIGMTNVENIKARSILAHHLQISPGTIDFPVIGGLTPETSVPLLSNMCPSIPLSKANLQKITCAVKTSATKLHTTQGSQESLNRAYATAKLVKSIVTGLNGHPSVETVLSYQKIINHADYFSLPVLLGENGVMEHITLPNISQREKYILSHAIACMAADTKIARKCYSKLKMNVVKPISAPQNKLNKLKPPTIQNKQPQSQYSSMDNTTQNLFLPAISKETSCSHMKLKSTMDHIASTIYSCNEHIQKSMHHNNMKSLHLQKSFIKDNEESKIVSDTALHRKRDDIEVLHQIEKQSGPRKSEVYPFIDNENIDETKIPNQLKPVNIKPEMPTKTQDLHCMEDSNAIYTNLGSDEPLPLKSIDKKGNFTIQTNMNLNCINNQSVLKRSPAINNIKLASGYEKALDENAVFKSKTKYLNASQNIIKLNTEEKIISSDPIVNFIKPISESPQPDTESKNCAVKEHQLPLKYNNTVKQYTISENLSTVPQEKKIITDNLERIFTSNIIRMVNEMQNRKHRLIVSSDLIRDQSKYMFDKSAKVVDFGSKSNTKNDQHFDSFKMRSTDDNSLGLNKTSRDSISDISFIISNDSTISGKKYSLQANQSHWILQSMLFKSEKYLSSKLPILSRYVSSESRENKIKNKPSVKEIQTRINKSQEPLWLQSVPSKSQNEDINNKQVISSNGESSKEHVTPLQKLNKNIKSTRYTFLSRYRSSESNYKETKNKEFIGINSEIKIQTLPKFNTKTIKSHESFRTCKKSWDKEMKKPYNEDMKYEEAEALKPGKKLRRVKSLVKSQTYINKPNEPITITSEPDSYDNPLPPPKFRLAKYYNMQRKLCLNSKEPSDTFVFENLIKKQRDSISTGHKIASFKTGGSKDSVFVLQRKEIGFEMLKRNKPNDLQKLHLLKNNSNESVIKDKSPKKEIKSLGQKYNWKNNNESLMTIISKQQITEKTGENVDNVQHECSREKKKNDLTFKDGEREKDECITKTSNNSNKDVKIDICSPSNSKVTKIPLKVMKKEIMQDRNEPNSEKIMSDIISNHVSKQQENETSENSGDSNINSKYIQQRTNLDSETSSISSEGIKREKISLERTLSKGSENKTV